MAGIISSSTRWLECSAEKISNNGGSSGENAFKRLEIIPLIARRSHAFSCEFQSSVFFVNEKTKNES
jgi:hypothetical protein